MATLKITNLGAIGVIRDGPTTLLPPNAFTRMANVRCLRGGIERSMGRELLNEQSGEGLAVCGEWVGNYPVIPYDGVQNAYVQGVRQQYFLYSGETASGSGLHHFYLTPALGSTGNHVAIHKVGGYTSSRWRGCLFNGILAITNGADNPQYWGGNPSVVMADFPAWFGSDVKDVQPFKNFLVAFRKSDPYPDFLIRWSHSADPGSMPTSWDISDTSKDAGEITLADGGDQVVTGRPLGDAFYIYKEDSTWRMTYIGPPYIMAVKKVFGNSGILNDRCVCEFEDKHFVVTQDDIIVHDGNQKKSIGTNTIIRDILSTSPEANRRLIFTQANPGNREIWVFWARTLTDSCDSVYVWNWETGAWSSVNFGVGAFAATLGTPWVTAFPRVQRWNANTTYPFPLHIVTIKKGSTVATSHMYVHDFKYKLTQETIDPECYVERFNWTFTANQEGQPIALPNHEKTLTKVWLHCPTFTGTGQVALKFRIAVTDAPYPASSNFSDLTYRDYNFTGSTADDIFINVLETGRYFHWALIDTEVGDLPWRIEAIVFEFGNPSGTSGKY